MLRKEKQPSGLTATYSGDLDPSAAIEEMEAEQAVTELQEEIEKAEIKKEKTEDAEAEEIDEKENLVKDDESESK